MLKQAAKYASLILQTLGLMESFVEDLLNLRLMSEGILTLAKDVFDPREAFNFIKDTFAIKVESKGIKILYDSFRTLESPTDNGCIILDQSEYSPSSLPSKLIGDERRLKQVMINLVKNSFKFTQSGGKIQIKTSYNQQKKTLIVHV